MRVLLVPFPGSWRTVGGHRTQQLDTARALRQAGATVAIGDVGLARPGRFDIVHLFGDPRPSLDAGRPSGRLVVSPVHMPPSFELGPVRWHGGRRAWVASQLRHRSSRSGTRAPGGAGGPTSAPDWRRWPARTWW